MGDGGAWLRRQILVMSKNNKSSPDFWLNMPLVEFRDWIETNNEITEDENKRMKG